jgi:hypothetical protein
LIQVSTPEKYFIMTTAHDHKEFSSFIGKDCDVHATNGNGWDSTVRSPTVTGYGLGNRGANPDKGRHFSQRNHAQAESGTTQFPIGRLVMMGRD